MRIRWKTNMRHTRFRPFGEAGLCLWVFFLAFMGCQGVGPVEVGQEAPDFSVLTLSGSRINSEDLRGKNVLVHFWATWCPPCLVELPGLIGFSNRLDSKKFFLLAVCVDNTEPEKIQEFLRTAGFEIPVCLDPGGKIAARFGTFKFPETYFLDSKGSVRRKVVGNGNWTDPTWEQFLHQISDSDESQTVLSFGLGTKEKGMHGHEEQDESVPGVLPLGSTCDGLPGCRFHTRIIRTGEPEELALLHRA